MKIISARIVTRLAIKPDNLTQPELAKNRDTIEAAASDPLRRFPLCLISLVLIALISFGEAALAHKYRAPRAHRLPQQPRYHASPPAPYRPYQQFTPEEQRIIDGITRRDREYGR
jgi:hypothetical protein